MNSAATVNVEDCEGKLLSAEQVDRVISMLTSIAGVCDNAKSKDDMGFSKADLIGHYIAELPVEYMDNNLSIVSLMLLRKYKRQLAAHGYEPAPLLDILGAIESSRIEQVRSDRVTYQKRRVLINADGDFELYFPTLESMRGFNKNLCDTNDWITEKDIPHGYLFIVKRGARAFIEDLIPQFSNWLIPDATKEILADNSNDSIDVSGAINYDLYVFGESATGLLTIKWDEISRFLSAVRAFSSRRFNGEDAWHVQLKNEADFERFKDLIGRDGVKVYLDKGIAADLENEPAVRQTLIDLEASEALRRQQEREANRPKSLVTMENEKFIIKFSAFNYAFVDWIKANLKEKKFNKEGVAFWSVETSDHNIIALNEKLEDTSWAFSEDAAAFITNHYFSSIESVEHQKAQRILALRLSSQRYADEDFEFDQSKINGTPFPFQKLVVQYNTVRKNMLIGDDMGVGKSLSALACAANNDLIDSVNITCPAIARLTWRNEILKWLPGSTFYICKKATSKKNAEKELKEILEADFVIVGYKKLDIYQDVIAARKAKLFIGDESQYLKNPTAQRTKAAMKVAESCGNVYLLSGTPLKNRPVELIPQLKMLRVLDSDFGGEYAFKNRYCDPVFNGYAYTYQGSSNESELRQKLRESCMVRRLKDDVMEFLPEKIRMRIPVEIPNRAAYDKANNSFKHAVVESVRKQAEEEVSLKLSKAERAKAIDAYINERIESAARAQIIVHINLLRQIVAAGLQEAACEWIEEFCATEGKPLVVFAYHEEQQKYLYNYLKENTELRVAKIVSGMKDEVRKQAELDFLAGKFDVIVCGIGTANTNINLTAATNVLTVEYLWTPTDHLQAEDRSRRIGTSIEASSINCFYLHADDTVDDLFWDVIVSKFKMIERSMDNDDGNGFENVEEDTRSAIINGMIEKFDFIKAAA